MQPLKNCLIQTIPDPNLSNINHADWSIPATKNFLSTPVVPDHLYTLLLCTCTITKKKDWKVGIIISIVNSTHFRNNGQSIRSYLDNI